MTPKRIIDLHTHLFNARYVPLAGIIAHAMGKDESWLAKLTAAVLEELCGSSYDWTEDSHFTYSTPKDRVDFYLDRIWQRTEQELTQQTRSLNASRFGISTIADKTKGSLEFIAMRESQLYQAVDNLSHNLVPAAKELGIEVDGPLQDALQTSDSAETIRDVLKRSETAVKAGLLITAQAMKPGVIDEHEAHGNEEPPITLDAKVAAASLSAIGDYLEFFLTMLDSEESLVKSLLNSYGSGLPPLQVVHFMMDMQFAFPPDTPYSLYQKQLDNIAELQRRHGAKVFGFAAFDPRRPKEEWDDIKTFVKKHGFVGFKFYPSMGYRASSNTQPGIDPARIAEFFDYCVATDTPVFTHCTPKGFQTRQKWGINCHPKYWRPVLENPRWSNLRICFGHAGGTHMSNIDWESGINITSFGWFAHDDTEWRDINNFARGVVQLCKEFKNVYCEVGYLTDIFSTGGPGLFLENLRRARAEPGPYDLLDKMAYGSDWHMPSIVSRTREYLDIFLGLFTESDLQLAPYTDRFFYQNACRFMKIPY